MYERSFVTRWIISAIAIIIASYLISGVHLDGIFAALAVSIVLGLLNTFIRPVFVLMTLPLNILTLGLFTLIINALLIMLTSAIVPGFKVDGFLWAVLFGLVLTLVNTFLDHLFDHRHRQFEERNF